MPIIGEWRNPALKRCVGKQAYRRITIAEKVAERDSLRTGELIIGYQCFDCERFHVGHADESQKIARQRRGVNLPTTCPHCGEPIPEERRQAARESGNLTVYCSKKCSRKGAKKARNARRAQHAEEYAAWLERYEGER
jgi:predicted sulfurtransferase